MKQIALLFILCFAFIVIILFTPHIQANQPLLGGTTERINLNNMGEEANGDSDFPAISADGRYVAFSSSASNLVISDTNSLRDIFVVDRETGLVERVNVSSTGEEANGLTGPWSAISADGRFVTFYSAASNLVISDTNGFNDIFVHDRWLNITKRVSVHTDGTESNGNSLDPDISADGRYIVFRSDATTLVSSPSTSGRQIYRHDYWLGITELISLNAEGEQGNGFNGWPAVSADGRFIAFRSTATNLVPNDIIDAQNDIYVRDHLLNINERANWTIDEQPSAGLSSRPSISADGTYIIFTSFANNHVAEDLNNSPDVLLYTSVTGTLERISNNIYGRSGNDDSFARDISPDGRFIAFSSWATDLVVNDTNSMSDVFVYDRLVNTIYRVSVNSQGQEGDDISLDPAFADTGYQLAFHSYATNLILDDTNDQSDIFLHEWQQFMQFFPLAFHP